MRGDVPDRSLRRTGAHAGAVALAVAIVAAALAGCGGDGDTGSSSARASTTATSTGTGTETTPANGAGVADLTPSDARRAAEAVLASSDPADACGRYVTQHYLDVAYGGRAGCVQAQAPGSAAHSLRSFRIVNEGTQGTIAIAVAVPDGGPYDGSEVTIKLIGGSHGYRVNALHSSVPVGP